MEDHSFCNIRSIHHIYVGEEGYFKHICHDAAGADRAAGFYHGGGVAVKGYLDRGWNFADKADRM